MTDHQSSDFKLKRSEDKVLPPDTYTATIVQITEQPSTRPDFGDQLRWRFQVDDPEGGVVFMSGWTSMFYSPKSKTMAWVKATLGEAPDEFTAPLVLGKRVRILVTVKDRADGSQMNKVETVIGPVKEAHELLSQATAEKVAAQFPNATMQYVATATEKIPF